MNPWEADQIVKPAAPAALGEGGPLVLRVRPNNAPQPAPWENDPIASQSAPARAISQGEFNDRFGTAPMVSDESGDPALRSGLESAAEARGRPTKLKSAVSGAAQGILFGLADEAASAVNAGIDVATGQAPDGFGAAYDRRLESVRRQDRDAAAINPKSYLAGQIGGGVAMGAGLAGAGLLATPYMAASSLPARLAVAGGEGGALAATYGFGAGEGGAENRLASAAKAAPLSYSGFWVTGPIRRRCLSASE